MVYKTFIIILILLKFPKWNHLTPLVKDVPNFAYISNN